MAEEKVRKRIEFLAGLLRDPDAELRAYAVTRRGREAWAPLALVMRSVQQHHAPVGEGAPAPGAGRPRR